MDWVYVNAQERNCDEVIIVIGDQENLFACTRTLMADYHPSLPHY